MIEYLYFHKHNYIDYDRENWHAFLGISLVYYGLWVYVIDHTVFGLGPIVLVYYILLPPVVFMLLCCMLVFILSVCGFQVGTETQMHGFCEKGQVDMVYISLSLCVCVCVCVCMYGEREREREREFKTLIIYILKHTHKHTYKHKTLKKLC